MQSKFACERSGPMYDAKPAQGLCRLFGGRRTRKAVGSNYQPVTGLVSLSQHRPLQGFQRLNDEALSAGFLQVERKPLQNGGLLSSRRSIGFVLLRELPNEIGRNPQTARDMQSHRAPS